MNNSNSIPKRTDKSRPGSTTGSTLSNSLSTSGNRLCAALRMRPLGDLPKEQVVEKKPVHPTQQKRKINAKRLNRSIAKRFINEHSESSSASSIDKFLKMPSYKEDDVDYALANMSRQEFTASKLHLSRSDEDNFGWVDLDIRKGIDEIQVLDGPRLFDTETTGREEQAKRWLLERGIQIKQGKATVAARQIDMC